MDRKLDETHVVQKRRTAAYGRAEFKPYKQILIDKDESYASNTLWINNTLLTPRGFPKTLISLKKLGMPIIELEMSEARKMDGGLSCMSLRF